MTTANQLDWGSVASNWDAHRGHVEAMKSELTAALCQGLALTAGDRVLELGAGTGALAQRLALAVHPGGSVLASDVAPGMVELIRAGAAGHPEIEVAQIDANDIPLAGGSFDAIAFRMGLMLLPEPARALAECRRVLAPGGRIAIAVWAGPQFNPWLTTLAISAMMQGLMPAGPPTGPGNPFSLAEPAEFEAVVTAAGFTGVDVRAIDGVASFSTADEHFDTVRFLAPPLAAALSNASPEVLAEVRAATAAMVEKFRAADGLRIPLRALLCTAYS
jgi:SAM-dependent methyltransferase